MGSLGDFFPEQQVQKFIADNFKVGCVIRVDVIFPNKIKPKYLVLVADNDPECLTFIVNSETNPFINNREHLAKCQVDIDAKNHTFLDYDSKIACHDVLKLKRADVLKELKQDTSKIKGCVSDNVFSEILSAVKFAKTLSQEDKITILGTLA
jgi:hypothetical protein